MNFSYVAVDPSGEKQKGIIESTSEKDVIEFLRGNNYIPISVKEKKDSSVSALLPFKKVKNKEIVVFTRQLSSMILTGLTLSESLGILKRQTTNSYFAKIIENIIANISEGKSFSLALSNHKDIFSDVYIALVKAAEASGLLDKVLLRLADNLEKMDDLKGRIKSALFYPIIVIVGIVGVIILMNVVVIPQLATLYTSLNVALPLTTRIILGMSKVLTTLYPVLILLLIGLYILYFRLKKTAVGIRTLDKMKLKIPVLGPIITLAILDEITRTLSLLISSGTSIIESLNITANVASNIWYKESILKSSSLVEKGIALSKSFESQEIFPIILIQMTKVGETTGKMDESLEKIAEYFERDLDLKIKTLTTSIEPILIIFLGVTVGFLIFSIITPIYSLISQIQ